MENNKVYGFDIDKFSADEILEKAGIAAFGDAQLKEAFLECVNNIEFSYRNENNDRREKTQLESAPTAYATYKRFYRDVDKVIDLKNTSLQTEHLPNSIHFWTYPAAINLLYIQMIKDKLYKPLLNKV